jgi:hypothetical protein
MFLFYSNPKTPKQETTRANKLNCVVVVEEEFEKVAEPKQYRDASTNTELVPSALRDYRELFKKLEDNRRQEILHIAIAHLPHVFFLAAVAMISAK